MDHLDCLRRRPRLTKPHLMRRPPTQSGIAIVPPPRGARGVVILGVKHFVYPDCLNVRGLSVFGGCEIFPCSRLLGRAALLLGSRHGPRILPNSSARTGWTMPPAKGCTPVASGLRLSVERLLNPTPEKSLDKLLVDPRNDKINVAGQNHTPDHNERWHRDQVDSLSAFLHIRLATIRRPRFDLRRNKFQPESLTSEAPKRRPLGLAIL